MNVCKMEIGKSGRYGNNNGEIYLAYLPSTYRYLLAIMIKTSRQFYFINSFDPKETQITFLKHDNFIYYIPFQSQKDSIENPLVEMTR